MKKFGAGLTPELPVSDVAETVKFYEEKLGFKLVWIWLDDFACVQNGEVQIFLSRMENPNRGAVNYIFVENADAVYELFRKNRVNIITEISSTPWGMREFMIEDCNGHIFRIGHGEKQTSEIAEFSSELK